ncbi:hypothetical protein MGYG_05861 [Nannizzia gypsea CBS 118893]|uniref:Uncharacterized protein n=1 Tax=Arthroderma gypseum (strain ATCC MYA-4604 / CBS 118893) TaxID=535722 RepID=E4UZS3_ARTGP|nr:hypothetical protein MGYG_05861 [Nannizzia gypsea CBS 118893]EFR02860.1 hypothetical protein MGYG_05861 [Nannizzia gypsea CBS 118893]
MVYDWEGKRDVCYRMYIEEKKPLEDIIEYMRAFHQFSPSKRAFQTQFKRWGFPSKQNPAYKRAELVARIKQLWENNTSQRDMIRILNAEGYEVKEREVMRVRAKYRWLLRVPNGMRPAVTAATSSVTGSALSAPGNEVQQQPERGLIEIQRDTPKGVAAAPGSEGIQGRADREADDGANGGTSAGANATSPTASIVPENTNARRKERLEKLKAESEERWATKRRRRRTREWAGLPPDPPGPPRFPSETTIDQSKKYLGLDNDSYRGVREAFQRICEEAGLIKKTLAGPEKWQMAKDRLINESTHLQTVFWGEPVLLDAKALALDVVCTDVTKRMRTIERRMTIAEAKNALGINPEESRQVRNAFYEMLKASHVTSKLEAGNEQWMELKDQWIRESELLQHILNSPSTGIEHATRLKAVEVLCRDVMKRLRDDQTKRDSSRKRPHPGASTPKPAPSRQEQLVTPTSSRPTATCIPNRISTLASEALASAPTVPPGEVPDIQVDPSLLQAAADGHSSLASDSTTHQPSTATTATTTSSPHALSYVDPSLHAPVNPRPLYFHIHPQSSPPCLEDPDPWIDKLTVPSVAGLRSMILSRIKNAQEVVRIEGIDTAGRSQGQQPQHPVVISDDTELNAYLQRMKGFEATFIVLLR